MRVFCQAATYEEMDGGTAFVAVGWFVALSLLIPTGIGYLIDRKFETTPMFMLAGLGLGTLVMVFGVYRMIRQVQMAEDDSKKSDSQNNG